MWSKKLASGLAYGMLCTTGIVHADAITDWNEIAQGAIVLPTGRPGGSSCALRGLQGPRVLARDPLHRG